MLTKSQIKTPYGDIQTLTVMTDGISRFYARNDDLVITEGTALSPERNALIPLCARLDDGIYGGIDRHIVDVVFAEELSATIGAPWGPRMMNRAKAALEDKYPELFANLMAEQASFPKPPAVSEDTPGMDF